MRSEMRRLDGTTEDEDKLDHKPRPQRKLLGGRATRVRNEARRYVPTPPPRLGDEGGVCDETSSRWRLGSREDRAVAIEPQEVERARTETGDPELDRPRAHAVGRSHALEVLTSSRLRDRGDDHLDPGYLPGKGIHRENPLPVPTVLAARERDQKPENRNECLELPLHSAARQPQPASAALRAAATIEHRTAHGERDLVAGRMLLEYVGQRTPRQPREHHALLPGLSSFFLRHKPSCGQVGRRNSYRRDENLTGRGSRQ